METTRIEALAMLLILWTTFYMKFGAGLEYCMRVARKNALFIILGIEIDRA